MSFNIMNETWWDKSLESYEEMDAYFSDQMLSTAENSAYSHSESSSTHTSSSSSATLASLRPRITAIDCASCLDNSQNPPKTVNTERIERRRDQNRNAQRAYRERSIAFLKQLQDTIDKLREEHSSLSRHCEQQSLEVKQLRKRVYELVGRSIMAGFDPAGDAVPASSWQGVTEFDLVPYAGEGEGTRQKESSKTVTDTLRDTDPPDFRALGEIEGKDTLNPTQWQWWVAEGTERRAEF